MDELTADECRALLETSSVAHLAVVEESRPYVSPVSYVVVDDQVCLRTVPGRRMDAIRANPQVMPRAQQVRRRHRGPGVCQT